MTLKEFLERARAEILAYSEAAEHLERLFDEKVLALYEGLDGDVSRQDVAAALADKTGILGDKPLDFPFLLPTSGEVAVIFKSREAGQ